MPWEYRYTDKQSGIEFTVNHNYLSGIGSVRQVGFSLTDKLTEAVKAKSPEVFEILVSVIKNQELIFFAKDLSAGLIDPDEETYNEEQEEDFRSKLESVLASKSPFISPGNKEMAQRALTLIEIRGQAAQQEQEERSLSTQRRAEFNRKRDRLMLAVIKRDGYKCAQCDSTDDLTLDHIYPLSKGGSDALENLRILCRKHNSQKNNRIPEEMRESA